MSPIVQQNSFGYFRDDGNVWEFCLQNAVNKNILLCNIVSYICSTFNFLFCDSVFVASEVLKRVCFGSTQERKHFPHYCAPDRLGNDLAPIRGAPNRGPGCYKPEKVGKYHFMFTHGIFLLFFKLHFCAVNKLSFR